MKKNELNVLIREFVKDVLSPTQKDNQFVSKIYKSFNDLLGPNNCVQIGSYPRYTAVKPLHDLDILYIIGDWKAKNEIPEKLLYDLADKFNKEYENPTGYEIKIAVQTHSISFRYFKKNDIEVFAVDLVPALSFGLNEFNRKMFYVPEIIKQRRGNARTEFYKESSKLKREIVWIKTDPLGYIEVASKLNKKNSDFRKVVKFVKGWKNSCKESNDEFKLKSFHIEQIVTRDYQSNESLEIFDAVFKFFTELKQNILKPNIPDRANKDRFIDDYINNLTHYQRTLINQAVDAILIGFERIDDCPDVDKIINSGFYKRINPDEVYLFDQKIPTLIDSDIAFEADGFIEKQNGFRAYVATIKELSGIVDTRNSIKFKLTVDESKSDLIKWKVKNDNSSPRPRGEISDNHTLQNPETTAYVGNHFVEAYGIKNNICIAKNRVSVIVRK